MSGYCDEKMVEVMRIGKDITVKTQDDSSHETELPREARDSKGG